MSRTTADLSIGDFSRMTQLSVKTLRHYHDVGLVTPLRIDPSTGYRYYSQDQLSVAHVVRRLRALDMPVPEVKAVLSVSPDDRNALIGEHLERLEAQYRCFSWDTDDASRWETDLCWPIFRSDPGGA